MIILRQKEFGAPLLRGGANQSFTSSLKTTVRKTARDIKNHGLDKRIDKNIANGLSPELAEREAKKLRMRSVESHPTKGVTWAREQSDTLMKNAAEGKTSKFYHGKGGPNHWYGVCDRRIYSKLAAFGAGYAATGFGTLIGAGVGQDKDNKAAQKIATDKEVKELAEKKLKSLMEEKEIAIRDLNKRKEGLDPEDMDDLDRTEISMLEETVEDVDERIKALKKNPESAREDIVSKDHKHRNIGATVGGVIGASIVPAAYGLKKLVKK